MHQNRASLFASDFYRRRGYRREFRSEDHFYPFSSQKKSRFASDFLRRGNRASWGLKKSRDFLGSGKNRRRSRRESLDFGALRCRCAACESLLQCHEHVAVGQYISVSIKSMQVQLQASENPIVDCMWSFLPLEAASAQTLLPEKHPDLRFAGLLEEKEE